jgi:hypothetical protein
MTHYSVMGTPTGVSHLSESLTSATLIENGGQQSQATLQLRPTLSNHAPASLYPSPPKSAALTELTNRVKDEEKIHVRIRQANACSIIICHFHSFLFSLILQFLSPFLGWLAALLHAMYDNICTIKVTGTIPYVLGGSGCFWICALDVCACRFQSTTPDV